MPGVEPRAKVTALLRSQGLGVACGMGTVLLLAAGSVIMAAGGREASPSMDDVRLFFEAPSWRHAWFYLLMPLLALYALNTGLATWHSLASRWRAGVRAPSAYAASLIHVSFLVALLAHLVGGVASRERGAVVLGSSWRRLPGGPLARLLDLRVETLPGGMPRSVEAVLELERDGARTRAVVGFNRPLTADLYRDIYLLAGRHRPEVLARLRSGGERHVLGAGQSTLISGALVQLIGAAPAGSHGPLPVAVLRARAAGGGAATTRMVTTGRPTWLPGGGRLELERVETRPTVLLRARRAAGNPWALLSALLLLAGVALMWRRFTGVRAASARDDGG